MAGCGHEPAGKVVDEFLKEAGEAGHPPITVATVTPQPEIKSPMARVVMNGQVIPLTTKLRYLMVKSELTEGEKGFRVSLRARGPEIDLQRQFDAPAEAEMNKDEPDNGVYLRIDDWKRTLAGEITEVTIEGGTERGFPKWYDVRGENLSASIHPAPSNHIGNWKHFLEGRKLEERLVGAGHAKADVARAVEHARHEMDRLSQRRQLDAILASDRGPLARETDLSKALLTGALQYSVDPVAAVAFPVERYEVLAFQRAFRGGKTALFSVFDDRGREVAWGVVLSKDVLTMQALADEIARLMAGAGKRW
jgi:hypothetical protein